MQMKIDKGFTIIMGLAFITVILIAAVTLISIGTSEMRQSSRDVSRSTAYYAAVSGA